MCKVCSRQNFFIIADTAKTTFKKDETINFQLSFSCNCVVSVRMGFLFLLVLGMDCVILLWHSRDFPNNHFEECMTTIDILSY